MIDSLTSANHRDFAARYGGTCGFLLNNDGTKLLVQVGDVGHDRVYFRDVNGREYHSNVNSGVQFEFLPVDRGYFNGFQRGYHLARVPARQWHRGIHPQNTKIVRENWIGNLESVPRDSFLEGLHDIYVAKRLTVQEAFKEFKEGKRHGVALSKHFYINRSNLLMFLGIQIGEYVPENNSVILSDSLVYQEVMDASKRSNLPLEVQVRG